MTNYPPMLWADVWSLQTDQTLSFALSQNFSAEVWWPQELLNQDCLIVLVQYKGIHHTKEGSSQVSLRTQNVRGPKSQVWF